MKHKYEYIINEILYGIPLNNIFTYDGEATIKILMLKKGIYISYSIDEEQNESVFSDAIKKAMLIYIIKFSKPLKIKK